MAVKVYNNIIKEGRVTRGSIGITFNEDPSQTPALLDVYGGVKEGVFVREVVKNGPAEKAGMKPQDIIVTINGKTIKKGQDLIDTVADSTIGSMLKVGIIRDRTPKTLEVAVADRVKTFSDNPLVAQTTSGDKSSEGAQKFGITIGGLSVSEKQSAGYTGTGSVVIESVEPGSFADDIGLAKGDVILEINRQAVNSPEDVKRVQATLKAGDNVAFHVARQGGNGARGGGNWQPLFLAGRLTESSN
jgi:serine protease Do